jgi:hypothetical protein
MGHRSVDLRDSTLQDIMYIWNRIESLSSSIKQ